MRWDLTTGQTTPFGPTETDTACCFALSPDSQLIAFETWNTGRRARPHRIRSPGLVSRPTETSSTGRPGGGPTSTPTGSSATRPPRPAGIRLVVVDPISGDEAPGPYPLTSSRSRTSWSPDGTRIAAADANDRSGDIRSRGRESKSFAPTSTGSNDPEWLPAGDAIVVGGESTTRVVDAATGEIRTELLGQPGGTFQIEPVPGTDQFASAGFVDAVGRGDLRCVSTRGSRSGRLDLTDLHRFQHCVRSRRWPCSHR